MRFTLQACSAVIAWGYCKHKGCLLPAIYDVDRRGLYVGGGSYKESLQVCFCHFQVGDQLHDVKEGFMLPDQGVDGVHPWFTKDWP